MIIAHCSFNFIAQRLRLKMAAEASRDLISELPLELKVGILECLPIRDAARTAVLSTQWNDVWLRLGRLSFHIDFLLWHIQRCSDKSIVPHKIITYILLHRVEPVKKFRKFTLQISSDHPQPQQTDFDRWCLFLSRNGVEELNISLASCVEEYKLPFCLLSCRTIKQLIVHALLIDLPVNVVRIFSNVTSLAFFALQFKRSVNGIASSITIPKLEKLAFELCLGINKFEIISPPKLEILSVIHSIGGVVESRWLTISPKVMYKLTMAAKFIEHFIHRRKQKDLNSIVKIQ
nr:F-box/FBD/LRR-repeat protein At1g13570-like [Ipomoea batatas]